MRWRRTPAGAVAAAIARALLPPSDPEDAPPRALPLTDFQEEAVRRARAILARRGGVVIADEVGLGKTYVAMALAEEALGRGEEVVVVVPAAVRETWERLVRSAPAFRAAGEGFHLTTHARLSRGTHDAARLARAGLVVVDEAHAFRNPATRRYRALAEGVSRGRLVLITATPVNNSLADLYHLVRLFAADHAFTDVGVASLKGALLDARPREAPGEDALRVVGEVMVRRTREEARRWSAGSNGGRLDAARGEAVARPGDRTRPPLRFPARSPTRLIRYDDPRVPALVDGIERLELVAQDLAGAGIRLDRVIRRHQPRQVDEESDVVADGNPGSRAIRVVAQAPNDLIPAYPCVPPPGVMTTSSPLTSSALPGTRFARRRPSW